VITLNFPQKDACVSLQTDVQKVFLQEDKKRAQLDSSFCFQWYELGEKDTDRSLPQPVSFVWEEHIEESEEDKESAEGAWFYLLLSEYEDMRDPWVYGTLECHYSVYNLKVGTTYFWCVQKNGKRSGISTFSTCLTLPRCIKIDSISNVRDMGGYPVEEGRIRQGLVFRGGELERHQHLMPSGMEEMRRLGICTEVDLRGEVCHSVSFTTPELIGINRKFIPGVPYTMVFLKDFRPAVRKFFRVFTDRKNYPIYYHCWGGADRTGTYAFILGAFLGMRLTDLIFEYEFTSLSNWGSRIWNYVECQEFWKQFSALSGSTLREKATAYLKKYAGLSDKQLAKIYDILVEKD